MACSSGIVMASGSLPTSFVSREVLFLSRETQRERRPPLGSRHWYHLEGRRNLARAGIMGSISAPRAAPSATKTMAVTRVIGKAPVNSAPRSSRPPLLLAAL